MFTSIFLFATWKFAKADKDEYAILFGLLSLIALMMDYSITIAIISIFIPK